MVFRKDKMKYLIFILMISQLLFSIESGIYLNQREYENGTICNEVIQNGIICKKQNFESILLPEGKADEILFFSNENMKVMMIYNEDYESFIFYPLRKVNEKIYKSEKKMKKYSSGFGMTNSSERKIIEYDIILEVKDKEEVLVYSINNHLYNQKKYKFYKNLRKEQEITIQNYLKLIEELE